MTRPLIKAERSLPLTVAQKLGARRAVQVLRDVQRRRDERTAIVRRLTRPGRGIVWTDGQWIVSVEESNVVPARMSMRNFELVRTALESASVGHVMLSRSEFRTVQLAIHDDAWSRTLDALVTAYADEPVFLDIPARTVRGNIVRRAFHVTDPDGLEAAREGRSVRVFQIVTDTESGRSYGRNVACELQRWATDGETVSATVPNDTAQFVTAAAFEDRVTVINRLGVPEPRLAGAAAPDPYDVRFPIDLVYMWVDGDDPVWQTRFQQARGPQEDASGSGTLGTPGTPDVDPDSEPTAPWRFRDRDELLYSMRSVEMYAPWVNKIYLVTDNQAPVWLDLDHPLVEVVSHAQVFGDPSALPIFNSHAIGSQLHHIEGLSDHYLVMNDDVLFGATVQPEHFFTGSGIVRFRPSRTRAPIGEPETLSEIENARLNSARLLETDFGRRCSSLFAHTPVPQVRAVGEELERRYAAAYDSTMRSRFRSGTDFETNSWLQLNYLLLTGRAVESRVRYDYFNLGTPSARRRMKASLKHERAQVFCMNDGPSEDGLDYDEWLASTLRTAFPRPSSFELPSERWRDATAR